MEIKDINTEKLIPYANNARTHSPEQINKIAASIKEFGFTNPILTDGDNGIIAGHGRLSAAVKLGLKTVPVIELAHLSAVQKKAYILADNKLALDAGWDAELIQLELEDIFSHGFNIDLTGFCVDDIGIVDIENVDHFNETFNFTVKCSDINELESVKKLFGIASTKISAEKLLGFFNENSSS